MPDPYIYARVEHAFLTFPQFCCMFIHRSEQSRSASKQLSGVCCVIRRVDCHPMLTIERCPHSLSSLLPAVWCFSIKCSTGKATPAIILLESTWPGRRGKRGGRSKLEHGARGKDDNANYFEMNIVEKLGMEGFECVCIYICICINGRA